MRRTIRILSLFLLLLAAALVSTASAQPVQAKIRTSKWVRKGSKWRYRKANGKYAKKTFLKIGKNYYYFSKKGYVHTGWIKVGKYKYYGTKSSTAGKCGRLKTGWVESSSHKLYYFSLKSGAGKYGRAAYCEAFEPDEEYRTFTEQEWVKRYAVFMAFKKG